MVASSGTTEFTLMVIAVISPAVTSNLGSVEIQWGTAVNFSDSGKERKMGLGPPCMFRWRRPPPVVSCREGAKRPADSNKSPNNILSKRQDSPCENRTNGRGTGPEQKCANLTLPRVCRMKAENRFPRHFAVRHETLCGRSPPPRVSPARGMAGKRTNGVCTWADSIQSGKSLPRPCFSLLSAPAGSTLRQKSFDFAEGASFLCGKRFCFCSEKTTAGTEKCSIQTVLPSVF